MINLTRDSIINADDLPNLEVEVPEWGGSVWVKMMSAAERVDFESAMEELKKADKTGLELIGLFLCRVLIDPETGERLFADEDAGLLIAKNQTVLFKINDSAFEHNRIGEKAIEDIEKNLESSQSEDSAINSV